MHLTTKENKHLIETHHFLKLYSEMQHSFASRQKVACLDFLRTYENSGETEEITERNEFDFRAFLLMFGKLFISQLKDVT